MGEPPSEGSLSHVGVRRFRSRHKRGKIVELQDNSRWEICPGYEIMTDHWRPEADITVVPGPGGYPDYPYDLINSETGERVPGQFRGHVSAPGGWSMIDH